MNRALRSAPWLFAAGAVALALAGVGFSGTSGVVWRLVLSLVACGAAVIGVRVNRMPRVFALAIAVGGIRVLFLGLGSIEPNTTSATVANATSVTVGVALMVILGIALRFRRGTLDQRDGIDLVTIAISAAMSTWILITSRMIFVDDLNPAAAMIDTLYLPVAVLLLTFIIDLLLTGLRSNRTMQFVALSAVANVIGAAMGALGSVGMWSTTPDSENGMFAAAFLFLCAGLAHRDAPGTVAPDRSVAPTAAYTPFRLALTGACLVVPGVMVAALAPFGNVDVLVRTTALLALICTVIARLHIAVHSHEAANVRLIDRLHRDELTQLPTRTRFVQEVDAVLESTWRSEFQPTIVQLNLDRFKNINDSLGHYEANEVLVIVAERLSNAAGRFGGMVGRAGGDDFVVIDATTRSATDALDRLRTVRAALDEPVRVGETSVFVTASFGVATAPRNRTLSAEELMRRADIATHQAKAGGRNSVAVFDDSMHSHLARRMDVENGLHGAIGRQEMRLYHQPIVDIATGVVSGFESLIRWQRDGTIVPPGDFISIAEETGIINELGAWALREALNELRGWIDDGVVAPTTTISVNVSPRQIADPNFASVVRAALDESGMPPNLLWIEMTESMMLEEPELAQRTLREIREMGVRLALDDFGTGYSSLSLLQQFPIQRIKIDRAFVAGIAEPGNDRSLVRTVIAMAQSMGLDLVAEGVETAQQLQVLSELNCDKAQGYLISRPVPADAMRSTMVALDELASLSMFGWSDAAADRHANDQPGLGTHPTGRHTSESMPPQGTSADEPRNAYPISVGSVSNRPLGQPVL